MTTTDMTQAALQAMDVTGYDPTWAPRPGALVANAADAARLVAYHVIAAKRSGLDLDDALDEVYTRTTGLGADTRREHTAADRARHQALVDAARQAYVARAYNGTVIDAAHDRRTAAQVVRATIVDANLATAADAVLGDTLEVFDILTPTPATMAALNALALAQADLTRAEAERAR